MSDLTEIRGIPWIGETRIIPASTPEHIEQIRQLFREYADGTGACECFEGFGKEVAGLPGPYSPPTGQLLLAELDGRSAGCVALRRLDDDTCEMKRVYVRASFRGRHLGRKLAEAIITEARRMGYRAMRLDTLTSMVAAQALYQSMGFCVIPRYNNTPRPGVIHLELKL